MKKNFIVVKVTDEQQSELFNDLEKLLTKKEAAETHGPEKSKPIPKDPKRKNDAS